MKKLFLVALSSILLTACAPEENEYPVQGENFMLNTFCSITIYNEENKEKNATEIISDTFYLCSDYEKMISRTIEGSDIYKINHSNGQPVEVSNETIELLEVAQHFSELSDGALDITTEPLITLWDIQAENPVVPSDAEIQALLPEVDYTKVDIDGNTVTLLDPVEKIDLGAVAKGFIADKLADYLRENQVTSALISLGGNLYAVGQNDLQNRPFNLAVQNPRSDAGDSIGYISGTDISLVTSGDYQRYFMADGVRYHHIIDPETGYPTNNELASVTILSESSAEGDALSTACFVLGTEKGLELINSLDGIEAIFIEKDLTVHLSDGFGEDLEFNYL